jgi:hypothetical protein
MSRRGTIFLLTHGYPLFIAGHLYFGDWCRKCQVLFNVIPIIVFGGLILTWLKTSNARLLPIEQLHLKFFLWNLTFIYAYYCLCVFSLPLWIYDKNWQVSAFILITLIFYSLNHERK